jgi:ATP-binding cassette subfamily F protein 2
MPAKKKPEKKSTSKKSTKEEKSVILESDTIDENETEADKLRREGLIATYALSNKTIHRNVRDISVSNLTVTFHGTPLIEEAELTLNYGNRYGFIGRNGCGKSTFMRVIGIISYPTNMTKEVT